MSTWPNETRSEEETVATELATAYISLVPSARGIKGNIERELGGAGTAAAAQTESAFGKAAARSGGLFKSAMKGVAVGVAGVFAAGAVGAKMAITAASDYNESLSKVGAVFGPQQQAEIKKWADTAATAFGQSSSQAIEAAGTYGNLLTSFGLTKDKAAGMSKSLVGLASDLASFNNTSPEEALQALQSGLTGETEPLKKYGIAIDDASLKAKAFALGIADGKKQLTPAQKAQASYALIMERSTNAQGDFARTSGGLANQQRIFAARIEDVKVKIGQALLPAMNALLPVISSLFDKLGPLIDQAIPKFSAGLKTIGDWWAANGPAIMDTASQIATTVVTAFTAISGWVQDHWPQIQEIISTAITTVQTVIEGVVSVVTTLWQNFGDNILEFVNRSFGPLKQIIEGALNAVKGVIQVITSLIKGDWSGVWEGIKQVFSGVWNALQGIVKAALEQVRLAIGVALEVIGSVWKSLWEGLKNAAGNALEGVVGFFSHLPARIGDLAGSISEAFLAPFKAAFNAIANLWNDTVGSLSFKTPDWVPGIGGKGFDMPDIPTFHTGGVVPGRPGQEVMALLQAGETVVPAGRGGGGVTFEAGAIDARGITDPAQLAAYTGAHLAFRQSLVSAR